MYISTSNDFRVYKELKKLNSPTYVEREQNYFISF